MGCIPPSRSRKVFATAAFAFMCLFPVAVSAADLLSGDVTIVNYSPTLTDIDAGAASGPTASGINLAGFVFDFTSNTISYINPYGPDNYTSVGSGGFNGFVLTFTGISTISNVTNDPSSQLDPSAITFTGASVSLDFDGLPRFPGETSTFDVTFGSTAPEPGAWAMMLLGLGAAGLVLRTRRAMTFGRA